MSLPSLKLIDALTTPEGTVVAGADFAAGQNIDIDETMVTAPTDRLVNIAFAVANLKLIVILSSVDMTIETNSSSSPTNVLTLLANVPLIWRYDGYETNLITADVTRIYVTAAAAGTLRIRAVVDPTP
jgi:hypothetical protein